MHGLHNQGPEFNSPEFTFRKRGGRGTKKRKKSKQLVTVEHTCNLSAGGTRDRRVHRACWAAILPNWTCFRPMRDTFPKEMWMANWRTICKIVLGTFHKEHTCAHEPMHTHTSINMHIFPLHIKRPKRKPYDLTQFSGSVQQERNKIPQRKSYQINICHGHPELSLWHFHDREHTQPISI